MNEENGFHISWAKNYSETCTLRELCLELAFEGNFSARFQALWLKQPVVLGGEELKVLCGVAARGFETARLVRWSGLH